MKIIPIFLYKLFGSFNKMEYFCTFYNLTINRMNHYFSWRCFLLSMFVLYGGIIVNADEQVWDLTVNSSSSSSETSVVWTGDYVTMVLDKAKGTTAANDYLGGIDGHEHTRVYQNQMLSFKPGDNVEISSIVLTSTSSDYANEDMKWTNANVDVTKSVITVKPKDKSAVVSVVFDYATRFTKVVVTYSVNKTLKSIYLSGVYSTSFYVDDTFSHSGIVVTALYDDNSTMDVTQSATFSVPDMTSTGTKTVTVSFGGQSTEYTISVNEKPSYNITFSENGTVSEPVEYMRGEAIEFPEVTPPEGYSFMGWTTAELPVQQSAPEFVNTTDATAIDNTTFYAVYAIESGKTVTSVTDVLTRTVTGIKENKYSFFSGKKVTSEAVYAGNCAGDNNSIQLRSSNNNSGIVSTTSGGKVKKISVTWDSSTTSGRTLDIYGSNTPYKSASDVYNPSNKGTRLGSIVCGTSNELVIDSDYDYIGMRSHDGTMYLSDISITWGSNEKSYSNYCTLVSVPSVNVTISNVGYATLYYSDRALKVPVGVTAKTYTVANGKLTESKTYEADKVIPAGEAVVLKGAAGDYKFMATTTTEEKDANSMLKGSDESEETKGGVFYYALQAKAKDGTGGPGMYWMNSAGSAFTNGAHKAYMALTEEFAEARDVTGAKSFYLFEDATGISNAQADGETIRGQRFNMSGQSVCNGYKGIMIMNGKKFMQK